MQKITDTDEKFLLLKDFIIFIIVYLHSTMWSPGHFVNTQLLTQFTLF